MDADDLELLLDVLNSREDHGGSTGIVDRLDSADSASKLLDELGFEAESRAVSERDALFLRRVRDGLNGRIEHAMQAEPVDLDDVAGNVTLRIETSPKGWAIVGAGEGANRVAGIVLGLAYELEAAGDWPRLKVCRNHDNCRWIFFDHSKNRSRVWCDMATCGSRAKARAFRERRTPRDDR